jgi:hypothetical protein
MKNIAPLIALVSGYAGMLQAAALELPNTSALPEFQYQNCTSSQHITTSSCPIARYSRTVVKKRITDWRVERVPAASNPSLPTGLQLNCVDAQTSTASCLILKSADYSYWIYNATDKQAGISIVAYDKSGALVQRWTRTEFQLLVDIKINLMIDTIVFTDNFDKTISFTWTELTPFATPQPPKVAPKLEQVINFELPKTAILGDAPVKLKAIGGASENAVVFETATPSVCTVTGATLTFVSAGVCTVLANQTGNERYLAAPVVKQSMTITQAVVTPTPPPVTPKPNNTAPSQLCFNVTGTYDSERAGYCNDFSFSAGNVPCVTVGNGEVSAGECVVDKLMPRPSPTKQLTYTAQAVVGKNYSAGTPRCDSSTEFYPTNKTKVPDNMAFVCLRYEREAGSFYYGVALINNAQVLSYKLETTADKCVGNCPK